MRRARRNQDFEQRPDCLVVRLGPRGDECVPAIGEVDDVSGLDVCRRMLEEAEVVSGCVVEAVDRHWTHYRPVGGAARPPVVRSRAFSGDLSLVRGESAGTRKFREVFASTPVSTCIWLLGGTS
jgi:hypothetical protein